MSLAEELSTLLPEWLPRQRWFAAKDRAVASVTPVTVVPLHTDAEPLLDLVVAAVEFTDGGPAQRYQILVGRRAHPREGLDHAVIGEVGPHLAYDGLWDHAVTEWLLRAFRGGFATGGLRFVTEPETALPDLAGGRVLTGEQSNSSVAWGEQLILKLFRRILPGVNPDLELHRALRSVGSKEVATLQGAIEAVLDGEPFTLGMLQDYAANSADGWSMALASVRDLLAEGDLHADEVGGDFAAESARLGETVAVVHAELREALPTGMLEASFVVHGWRRRLATALEEVAALAPYAGPISDVFAAVAERSEPLPTQRVHGDLHLGQTLRTPHGWLLIDFEGEPSAPLIERIRPDAVLRDVAAMLRSFDYAAFHQLAQWDGPGEPDSPLVWHAREWANRNRSAFCAGYAERAGADPRDHALLMRAFELDKAVYEVVYETRFRPSWATIPMAAIERLTQE